MVEPVEEIKPCKTMPQTNQDHDQNGQAGGYPAGWSITGEEHEDMITEKIAQRRVPVTPKLRHGRREEWTLEVLRHRIAHQSPKADRHIRITGEIEVNECIEPDQSEITTDGCADPASTLDRKHWSSR